MMYMYTLVLFYLQGEVQTHLVEIQPNFKGDLLSNVEQFIVDVQVFSRDYEEVSHHFDSIFYNSVIVIDVNIINSIKGGCIVTQYAAMHSGEYYHQLCF